MLLSRRLVIVAFASSVAALGCKSSNPSPTTQPTALTKQSSTLTKDPSVASQATPTIITPAPAPTPGTAEALAQRANVYAQSMGPMPTPHDKQESQIPSPVQTSSTESKQPAQGVAKSNATKLKDEADARAFGAVPTVPDVKVQRQAPATIQTPAPLPATDAQTAAFARRAAEYPQDLAAQTDDQLLKLLKEESVPDLQTMSGLNPEDRELLSALMDALANFRNQLRQNNNMLFSKKIAPLADLGDRLKSQAELTVPTFTFVSQAPGFGRYQALEPARFMAGKPHVVGIYYEVENFSSQLNDNKLYETRLDENLVLYTESSGLPVWNDRKSTLTDTSHRRRHDFFNAKNITLPASLTIGRYLLKVTIEDLQAHRIAENTVPVEIVAQ